MCPRAISWSGHFCDLVANTIHREIPVWIRTDYRTFFAKGYDAALAPHVLGVPIIFNLPAVAIVLAITVILVIGIKESSRFNNLMVLVKRAVLALFVGVGLYCFTRRPSEH